HPFSHMGNPEHVERLADYWAEVLGGPARYSESFGGHPAMLEIHARQGAEHDLGERFVACFTQAMDDAHLPDDPDLRPCLRWYRGWAVREVPSYSPKDAVVPAGVPVPRWSWDGLV